MVAFREPKSRTNVSQLIKYDFIIFYEYYVLMIGFACIAECSLSNYT